MRITEKHLRSVIRSVIKEGYYRGKPYNAFMDRFGITRTSITTSGIMIPIDEFLSIGKEIGEEFSFKDIETVDGEIAIFNSEEVPWSENLINIKITNA